LKIQQLFSKDKVILLSGIVIVTISLSIFSYHYYKSTANQILETALKDIRSNAKIQANDLSLILANGLDSIITNLQILSSSPAVMNYDNDSLGLFDAVQKSTNELPDFYMWLDEDGELIWISGMNNTSYKNIRGLDLSHNQYYTVPRYTLAPYYSEGVIESIDNIPRMYISYPIIDSRNTHQGNSNSSSSIKTSLGTFKGVVVAAISFDLTNNLLKKLSSSEVARNSIILLDKSGEILFYSYSNDNSSNSMTGKNIFENDIEFLVQQGEILDTFLKQSIEGSSGFRDIIMDGSSSKKSTIISDPVIVDGKHFWTVSVIAPHYLASDVTALFNQQNDISIFIIIVIALVAIGISIVILSWNKSLESLVNTRTTELRSKSEELNRANESLIQSNKQIISVNQQLSLSNEQLAVANERLESHDKIQKEFINIAAHELRTPIMPILGGLELLDEKLDNDIKEKIKEELSMIRRNADRLHKLAEDILEVSSIESGNFRLDRQETDLNFLISHVISDIQTKYDTYSRKNVSIVLYKPALLQQQQQQQDPQCYDEKRSSAAVLPSPQSLSSKMMIVKCDPVKIAQVLFNLLDNALKFTDQGQIIVSIGNNKSNNGGNMMTHLSSTEENRKEQIIVSIKDTGKGIDSSIKDRLFQKFATESVKGTGLGLYLSKKIIEAHEGRIWAENNIDGSRGATFYFSLPLTETNPDYNIKDKKQQ
jgi:signal transduction histidine kinase